MEKQIKEAKDGIYYQFDHFQHNQPDIAWADVETNLVTSKFSLQTQIEFMRHKKTQQPLNLDSIWGIVVDGIPYVRLPKEAQKKSAMVFSGLTLRGKICYFQFEDFTEHKIPITAYIPETGQPYVTKNVVQKENITREKLLKFETGEMIDFTLSNFKNLIADDKDLFVKVIKKASKELLPYERENLINWLFFFTADKPESQKWLYEVLDKNILVS